MPVPSSSKPVMQRRLLRDEAHDAIRGAILDGSFAPGERLEDHALQEWLGISRTPIRDALNALAMEGLVEIAAQSRTTVVDPDPERVEDSLQALGVIMGGVMRITIPSFDDGARAEMLGLVDEALAHVERRDQRSHVGVGIRVYEMMIARCPNPVMEKLARNTIVALAFRVQVTADARTPNWELLVDGWTRVRAGIAESDPVQAELAFEEMHRLPIPGGQWSPAPWTEPEE